MLIFSLPMLSFAAGVRHPDLERLEPRDLLPAVVRGERAGRRSLLALIGVVFAKKAKKGKGPQKVAASVKETAGVLQNAKPHPRPSPSEDAVEAVARSSS